METTEKLSEEQVSKEGDKYCSNCGLYDCDCEHPYEYCPKCKKTLPTTIKERMNHIIYCKELNARSVEDDS